MLVGGFRAPSQSQSVKYHWKMVFVFQVLAVVPEEADVSLLSVQTTVIIL